MNSTQELQVHKTGGGGGGRRVDKEKKYGLNKRRSVSPSTVHVTSVMEGGILAVDLEL
jgi:hypothetical protein